MIVPSDLAGLSDLTRVNGLNGKGEIVFADNLGVGRFRNGSKGCVMKFGVGDVIAAVAVDDVVVGGGDATVVDADVVDDVAGVGALDDAVDFDDNSGKLVYYDDFDSNFDIDVPGGNYSLLAYDAQEQDPRW